MQSQVVKREIEVWGSKAYVFEGGTGPAILLIHGSWGGAYLHWSSVWEPLAEHHRVIAPELPGLGQTEQAGFRSTAEYVAWLVVILDLLKVEQAIIVGNALGGSLAWALAGTAPERCTALVIVDGLPLPASSRMLRRIGRTRLGAALARHIVRWYGYRSKVVAAAFADIGQAPHELFATLALRRSELIANVATLLVEGDDSPSPQVIPHFLWGQQDRLIQAPVKVAERLRTSMPGSTLDVIPSAGHFPQIEEPELFMGALETRIHQVVPAETWQWPP